MLVSRQAVNQPALSVQTQSASTQAVAGSSHRGRRSGGRGSERWTARAMVTPAMIVLIVLGGLPTLYVAYQSLFATVPGLPARFVGLDNYLRLYRNPRFWTSLRVTGVFIFVGVGLQLLLGLTVATALNKIGDRTRRFATAVLIVPMLIPPVAVGTLWNMLFKARVGLIDYVAASAGFGHLPWVSDSRWALASVLIADVWQWTPFTAVILLAGLQSQPLEVHEAARIDGATGLQRFWRISLPLLRPFIALALVLRVVDAFKTFDLVAVMTRGGPGASTESVAYFTYVQGFTYFDTGLTAAMSLVQLVILLWGGMFLWRRAGGVRKLKGGRRGQA